MTSNRLRALAVLLILASTAALGHWARPTKYLANEEAKINLEAVFPRSFGSWHIDNTQPVSIVSPDVQAMLNKIYNQVLSRTYVDDQGNRIMLSVAYGGDQSDATRAHRPDVCYPAQGFQILSNRDASITLPNEHLPVRHMVAQLGQRVEPVTFWFTVGDGVAVSGQDQKLMQLKYGLRGYIPDGMLVRVSNIDQDTTEAYALQARFVQEMRAAFNPTWAARVFGVTSHAP